MPNDFVNFCTFILPIRDTSYALHRRTADDRCFYSYHKTSGLYGQIKKREQFSSALSRFFLPYTFHSSLIVERHIKVCEEATVGISFNSSIKKCSKSSGVFTNTFSK